MYAVRDVRGIARVNNAGQDSGSGHKYSVFGRREISVGWSCQGSNYIVGGSGKMGEELSNTSKKGMLSR